MTDIPSPSTPGHRGVHIEALLAHRQWVRALARSLVRDESSADDVEQRTWQVALENPPTKLEAARSWLGSVVRRTVLESQRKHVRRERRELVAARPEGLPSTAEVVARVEIDRAVVNSVAELAEPYRTTLLLRFYDGLPPREVAERMGVPVETVRTRVRRGLERVRAQLDTRHGGDRDVWMAALVPFLAGPGGLCAPDATTGGGAVGVSLGAVAATVAVLVVGVVGGRQLALVAADGDGDPAALAMADRALADERTELASVRAQIDELRAAEADREARLGALREVPAPAAAEPEAPAPDPEERAPFERPFAFPAYDEALDGVDWDRLGDILARMIPLLEEVHVTRSGDEALRPETVGRLQTHNGEVSAIVGPLEPRFPGGASNAALTHPAFTVTMTAALCQARGLPLGREQITALDRLAKDAADDVARATDGSAAFRLEALIEETVVKRRFATDLRAVLRPEQRALLGTEAIQLTMGYDLFGPAQMWIGAVEMAVVPDPLDLAPVISRGLSRELGLDREATAALDPVVAEWIEALPAEELAQATTLNARRDDAYPVDDIVVSARHMLDLMRRIDALELSDASRAAVRNSKQVLILRRAP